jgi:zinc and cadmium transporter
VQPCCKIQYICTVEFWWLFILFFLPFIGGIIGTIIQTDKKKYLKLFLAFSGAFLVSITLLNLIPEVYHRLDHTAGYYILAGFFMQILLDYFSKGIEHGHMHTDHLKPGFPLTIFLALSIHALLEGIGLGGDFFDECVKSNLVFAIGLHEMPAAFALAVVFKTVSKNRNNLLWIALYALMVPIGVLIGGYLSDYKEIFPILISLVIGVFLHIGTTILFENSETHNYGKYKLIAIAIGVGIAVLAVNVHFH